MDNLEFRDIVEGMAKFIEGLDIIEIVDWDIYAEVYGIRVVFVMNDNPDHSIYGANRHANGFEEKEEDISKATFKMVLDLEKLRVWFERNVFPDLGESERRYSINRREMIDLFLESGHVGGDGIIPMWSRYYSSNLGEKMKYKRRSKRVYTSNNRKLQENTRNE